MLGGVHLHSRPQYHAWLAVLRAALPALVIYLVWVLFGDQVINAIVLSELPLEVVPAEKLQQSVLIQKISNLSSGFGILGEALPFERDAALRMSQLGSIAHSIVFGLMAFVAAIGLFWSWKTTTHESRARNKVEQAVQIALISCSAVAVLTTLGIVLSMLGESIQFFKMVGPIDFFFGTVWNPAFATVGDGPTTGFGMLPLMAGTLLIAGIAMLVAIPIGLMSAIYMAEYAPGVTRAWAKPIIEVLAGIPTIVYGFFALVTVGPFLTGLGASIGIDIRANRKMPVGMMVETPAAALMLGAFIKEVDFVSIGTNDLIQYTLAVDRGNKEVADLYNACDPAVLRLLRRSLDVAAEAGVPANVCGQMSGSVMFTQLLLGMGLRQLSVPASAIPEVKQACRSVSVADCRLIAEKALTMDGAREVKAYLREQVRRLLAETVA